MFEDLGSGLYACLLVDPSSVLLSHASAVSRINFFLQVYDSVNLTGIREACSGGKMSFLGPSVKGFWTGSASESLDRAKLCLPSLRGSSDCWGPQMGQKGGGREDSISS